MSAELMKGIDFNCPPVLTIRHQALASNVEKIVEPVIVNYEQVGSYNWFGTSKKPVIIVPGIPKFFRKWNGGKLKRETGIMMVDENHYMSPDYPMESLFQAAKICLEKDEDRRNFKFQDYDIVCDRNIIRKLYSVLGESSERKEKFRINVHRVGRIVVFVRCQACDKEEAPKNIHLYGKDFVTRCTEQTLSFVSGSYRQIVSYNFGNLKFLVRFEVNCVKYDENAQPSPSLKVRNVKLSDLRPQKIMASDLGVIRWGMKRTYHIIELTTRSVDGTFPNFVWPSMFFSGITSLAIGWHLRGKCRVEYYSIKEAENEFGGFPRENMSIFYDGLTKIVQFVRTQTENKSFAIVWEPFFFKDLKIYEINSCTTKLLPGSLLHFVRWN